MKICTITCHKVYNYGACLQAYALQSYLISKGYDARIIDYVKEGTNSQFDFLYISPNSKYYSICKKIKLLNYLFALLNSFRVNYSQKRKEKFEDFQKKYYLLTSRYSTIKELRENPPNADIYIAGSDQIWNPLTNNGKDFSYYLAFGDSTIKRISYAASFSVSSEAVTEEHVSFVKPLLHNFNKISVRESSGLDILKRVGIDGTLVLDPVFLLSRDEWCNLIPPNKPINEKYILVYHLFAESEGLEKFVKNEAIERGLKIVSINDRNRRNYADIQINNAGPIEFIHYIANAEMVVADSFHATSFALIFNKDFHVFYKFENINRMADLLGSLGIKDRLNTEIYNPIEWSAVNKRIEELRQSSMYFLELSS